ncbi:hypothetical protein SAMN02745830_02111 [Streptomyces sp. Amel2xC10]|nr:hypothetical protein SAMN02745830_02111 [Streptomyces sp. Amel2xC10]
MAPTRPHAEAGPARRRRVSCAPRATHGSCTVRTATASAGSHGTGPTARKPTTRPGDGETRLPPGARIMPRPRRDGVRRIAWRQPRRTRKPTPPAGPGASPATTRLLRTARNAWFVHGPHRDGIQPDHTAPTGRARPTDTARQRPRRASAGSHGTGPTARRPTTRPGDGETRLPPDARIMPRPHRDGIRRIARRRPRRAEADDPRPADGPSPATARRPSTRRADHAPPAPRRHPPDRVATAPPHAEADAPARPG